MVTNIIHLRFLSVPENVGLARVAIAALAGQAAFSLNDIDEIKVAVSEAVSNAIIHGYQGRTDGWVELSGTLDAQQITIVVEDFGVGIHDVDQARQASYSTDPERMGLGFVFMESFMHGLTVQSTVGQGTRVEMQRFVTIQGELSRDAQ
ncbi:anti-sigma F factor [Sulfobacillus sp. hq2]|uniref:Anti-sigma F factor n=1 Tax=Sulfobacillus thermotolerans TaxID=338644 RepID=A0ABN5GYR3_9FIRM|nr:anti-sigma F factor [Sulfobacillus sp. hq2]AUW93625.1 anti-sigma F factor [Sulfobacillus thermotolerans]MCY0907029.1 anti-sigma F factor [Sulfobacillus thermotolerans]